MEQFDVVIIGAATAGSFFARRIAEAGHSVLVLDKLDKHALGQRLDIFHVGKPDFARFGIPLPEENDDFAFEFTGGLTYSAFGRYPKKNFGTTVGMHMPRYIARLNRWAEDAGAKILLGASFVDFIYDDGQEDRLTWVFDRAGPGRWTGRREDTVGAAEVVEENGEVRLRYTADFRSPSGVTRLGFEDVIYLRDDGVIVNDAIVSRAGFPVGVVRFEIRE